MTEYEHNGKIYYYDYDYITPGEREYPDCPEQPPIFNGLIVTDSDGRLVKEPHIYTVLEKALANGEIQG